MITLTDKNNVIKLKYATNKYHPNAIWFDMKKGMSQFSAWQLKQELNAYSHVYEEFPLLKFHIILVDENGDFVLKVDNEFLECNYLYDLKFNHLDDILDSHFESYVEKCEICLLKPVKYQSKLRNKPRRRTNIPKGLRKEVFMRDNYTCRHCGAKKGDKKSNGKKVTLEVDHIIPVAKGGNDTLDNLQTLCFDCNRNKSDVIQ